MKRKKTEITIETHELWVIRRGGVTAWCPECAGQVGMITTDEAIVLTGLDAPAIYRSVAQGRLHQRETADGFLLVCLRSVESKSAQ